MLYPQWLGLFITAFLAATILPLSSEVVLTALLLDGQPPLLMVLIATAGNVMGSLTNYALGYFANEVVIKKWLRISDVEFSRAEQRFKRYGTWALCLAWVPLIGDPLTVLAGVLKVRLWWFLLLVTTGKCLRYVVLTYMVVGLW
ncbi:YqaA family protein [Alteromonas gilva]|uniref:DedA family protein n=1 Tax=Alteromonas gilva TaxID=2987522 RepID=A0ABT5KXN4_9ALTE|nr:YqaA family protein [Alteromonas gilva]MDC8829527.1 DedA family protein [Alteromonas gilva]